MKKKQLFLVVLAVVLILGASIGSTIAYFTTYAGGNGGYVIHLGHQSKIHDVYTDVKEIRIQNVADTADDVGKYPIFVRAMIYHGNDSIVNPVASENWTPEGEYIYYELPLYADLEANYPSAMSTTSILKIDVQPNPDADLKPGDLVDVLVTYQSVPAVFDPNGNPLRALAWANQADIKDIANAG